MCTPQLHLIKVGIQYTPLFTRSEHPQHPMLVFVCLLGDHSLFKGHRIHRICTETLKAVTRRPLNKGYVAFVHDLCHPADYCKAFQTLVYWQLSN